MRERASARLDVGPALLGRFLTAATGQDFPYDPRATAGEKRKAAQPWIDWHREREGRLRWDEEKAVYVER